MEDPFERAKKRLDEMKSSVYPTVGKAFKIHESVIVDYNANKQLLDKGISNKGIKITPLYRPSTIKSKKKLGLPHDRVILKVNGYLHRNIYVIVRDDEVEVTTDVYFAKYLVEKYGEGIFGVTDELLEEFTKRYILPLLKTKLDDQIAKP